jgi:hypothetical protein
VKDAGLAERIETVAGDFFADSSLPGGYDTILLSMILHDLGGGPVPRDPAEMLGGTAERWSGDHR